MLRLLFMPWYTYNVTTLSPDEHKDIEGLIAQPYIYGGVLFDYDNPGNNNTRLQYSAGANIISVLGVKPSNIIYKFYDYSSSNRYRGFPRLLYSNSDITSEFFYKQPTTIISGKYKLKNLTIDYNEYIGSGITIPIKTIINGKNFKYFVMCWYNTWRHSHKKVSTRYIGGYNEPTSLSDDTTPADLTMYSVYIGATINIDFGNTPQEIPQFVYDWLIQQFDKVYENVYTIKSTTGETLTTLTEAPPMTSATLSAVGNAKYLTLKGENDTNYTMEWTSETPQGKIFAGLATSKGGSIVIPVGETSTINLTESTDLYEVWQTYRPPTTTFDINLYKNSAEPNKVDKTADLSTVGTISGVLRQECSLINPEIIIQYDKPPDFNYCYIANFGRYYYVENIVSMRQNLWRVRLRCDVLMTYKTQILNLNARIARQQYTYSYRQIDSEIPFTNDPEITVQDIPNNLNLGKPHYENILLTVVDNGT